VSARSERASPEHEIRGACPVVTWVQEVQGVHEVHWVQGFQEER
jgi:hypothetical protein